MLLKVKKYLRRSGALLLVLVVLVSAVAVPAKASSELAGAWVDLFDYSMPNDGTSYYVKLTADSPTCWFDLPYNSTPYYVDFLYVNTGKVPTSITCTVAGKTTTLTNISLGDYVYRCYGRVGGNQGDRIEFTFNGLTGSAHITFKSIHYTTMKTDAFSTVGSVWLSSMGSEGTYTMEDASTALWCQFGNSDPIYDDTSSFDFQSNIYVENWQGYDYVDVFFFYHGYSFNSLSVFINNESVPFDISYVSSPSDVFTEFYVSVRVYLDTVNRSTDYPITISCDGTYKLDSTSYFVLESVTGFINETIPSPITILWNNLRDLLTDLFGGDDGSADNALTTQEEINVSVNNQLVGAVEDWNTHIEVVETGYDMAFTQTTPALNWIASLANGIYSGLGWFGRLYLLIGLVSVFMLVLSKSGLARKIGSGIRRGG